MRKILSEKALQLKPSATLAISAKEKELKSQGVDVVGFGAGEPDFPTPERIREAAKRSLDRCETFYTPVGGTPELRKAVAHRFYEDYQLVYAPDQILVSCGAKHSLYNIFNAILDPGDEVLIFAPYWVSYPEMVGLAEGKPVIVPTTEENLFIPDPEIAESLITPSTKAILINSPSNPSGVVYPSSVMEKLAELAEKHDLLVISDEIYDKLIYDGRKFTPFASMGGMKDRTIIVNGVSKTYAMTGLRIGYLATTNAQIVKAATDIQSQSTSNPSNPSQAAAVEALLGSQEEVIQMRQIFEQRRNVMTNRLRDIPGISLVKPGGAFYVFANISAFLGKNGIMNSTDFSKYLLDKHHVACVPGGPFGFDQHVRLSFASSEEVIAKGLDRIRVACQELR
jgi:aspartate aminotransferase